MNQNSALVESLEQLKRKKLTATQTVAVQICLLVQTFMKNSKQNGDVKKPFEELTLEEILLVLKIDGAAA